MRFGGALSFYGLGVFVGSSGLLYYNKLCGVICMGLGFIFCMSGLIMEGLE